jgi:hypothetical protein
MACYNGHFDVVQFLVENGADVEKYKNNKNRDFRESPIMLAVRSRRLEIAEFLFFSGNAKIDDSCLMESCDWLSDSSREFLKSLITEKEKLISSRQKREIFQFFNFVSRIPGYNFQVVEDVLFSMGNFFLDGCFSFFLCFVSV